jgi:hypothetical protein
MLALATLGCVAALAGAARAAGPEAPRRFALVVGANDGGPDRARLRFARTDASALATVMQDLGGVAPGDRFRLDDPTAEQLAGTLAVMAHNVALAEAAGGETQFVFYYSGHSDERGLLLGTERVDYPALRRLLDAVPADVQVAILDSCASGAFTRLKGGRKEPGLLLPAIRPIKGHAYLTSSSADEVAQESDHVGGSFFTHYLVSGLRGAADRDADRQVTLGEAYRFAYDETLARTEATRGGPQHANYDLDLAGSSDLVLTDLRATTAQLEIGADVVGRIAARGRDGSLAVELEKAPETAPILLALAPDEYEITVARGEQRWRTRLTVSSDGRTSLTGDLLAAVPTESATARGDQAPAIVLPERTPGPVPAAPPVDAGNPPPPPEGEWAHVPFNIGVFPPADVNARRYGHKTLNNVSLEAIWSKTSAVEGLSASLGVNVVDEWLAGAQLAVGGNVARGRSAGLQGAVGFNWADRHRGLQLGLLNLGREIRGLQLGLVNTAGEADASLGLVTITRRGGVWGNLWTSDTAALLGAVRFRARHTYTFLAFGGHPVPRDPSLQYGWGFGGHLALRKRLYVELDGAIYAVHSDLTRAGSRPPAGLLTTRLVLGFRPGERIAGFIGPSFNLLIEPSSAAGPADRPGYDYSVVNITTNGVPRGRAWPGFSAGIEF